MIAKIFEIMGRIYKIQVVQKEKEKKEEHIQVPTLEQYTRSKKP